MKSRRVEFVSDRGFLSKGPLNFTARCMFALCACYLYVGALEVLRAQPSMGVGLTTTMIVVVLALAAIVPAGAFLPARSPGLAHRTATRSVTAGTPIKSYEASHEGPLL